MKWEGGREGGMEGLSFAPDTSTYTGDGKGERATGERQIGLPASTLL